MISVFKKYLFAGLAVITLSACGGGGGDTPQDETVPAGSSNWDGMQWDQDNWS